jgi:hypothetical protein
LGTRYRESLEQFDEMLLVAVWLYRNFPDVDLVIDLHDYPMACKHQVWAKASIRISSRFV